MPDDPDDTKGIHTLGDGVFTAGTNERVRPPLRTTYTVVTLDVSSRAFKEIYDKLQAAGYEHTFSENNTQIDMTGIAIVDSGE